MVLTFFRDLVFWFLSRVPPFAGSITEMRYIPRAVIREGFVLRDEARPTETWVGRMLPQPEVSTANGTTTLLDVQLGKGFTLLAINCPTFDFKAELRHRSWQALSVQGIHVVSADMQPPLPDSYLVPLDNRFDEIMRLHHGEVILLRPDRYVVGAVRPAELETLALNVERLLGV